MADVSSAISERLDPRLYRFASIRDIQTPALAVYLDAVEDNISSTIRLLDGKPERWRPHIKTTKIGAVIHRLVDHGVRHFKCATTLELLTACDAGATDVLVAYPCVGTRALRVREIAQERPHVRISALVENVESISAWAGSNVGLFLDINAGMNRTGVREELADEIVTIAKAVKQRGLSFRGLHYYDGHHRDPDLEARIIGAHRGYAHLMAIASRLSNAQIEIEEIITSGTPAFPAALTYRPFQQTDVLHRVSPGTVVYNDLTSLSQLPEEFGYRPAALVIATVVSRPAEGMITCDAGHKSVSADSGDPTCAVLGRPDIIPIHPSEEHLPMRVPAGTGTPVIGEPLYLLPRHICPTVNNFDYALFIREGEIVEVSAVTARGRERPIDFPLLTKAVTNTQQR